MRSIAAAAVAALLVLTSLAQAALAPQHQRQAEIDRIMKDARVAEALRNEPITMVRFVEADRYDVRSESCRVVVRIIDAPAPGREPGWVGPREFDLKLGKAKCKP